MSVCVCVDSIGLWMPGGLHSITEVRLWGVPLLATSECANDPETIVERDYITGRRRRVCVCVCVCVRGTQLLCRGGHVIASTANPLHTMRSLSFAEVSALILFEGNAHACMHVRQLQSMLWYYYYTTIC